MRPQDIVIDYTNHRGERRERTVRPDRYLGMAALFFGATEHHPGEQWVLHAWDYEKQAWRTFAMKDIHSWRPAGG